ncbi:hypothetical protein GCM10009609_12930 [Pseudonocardia aurantiaca]|uniref:LysR substrate-binding domain-containing protein n=1 Tax=Pseudonocardia aurantiaca TaxID=75290 RepID=A0ABW4FDK1_9PSEU
MEYFAHPRIGFVPFRDAPPVVWALVWRRAGATARVRELARVLRAAPGPKQSRAAPAGPTIAP